MTMSNIIDQKYFHLFSNCLLTKGYDRSSIIDLQRKDIHFIPNTLYFILKKHKNKTIGWIKKYYNDSLIISDYFNFLLSKELGIYVDSHKSFPNIDFTYHSSSQITNAIVEFSENSSYDFSKVISQLNDFNCESLEIRFLSKIKLFDLNLILQKTEKSTLRSIVIATPFDDDYSVENLSQLIKNHSRIARIHIYQSKFNKVIKDEELQPFIIYNDQNSLSPEYCGNISTDYFSPCIKIVCESLSYNTCLHRKVCITSDGYVKNCPAMNKSFGDIRKVPLKDIVSMEEFQILWYIKKDDIEVCKDCEMRYVCHDCRAHITDPNNIYSKPLKCSYNPYNSNW